MDFINVTKENIISEHICCSISSKKGDICVETKKNWMLNRLEDGLVFRKANVRGKVFIEYIPCENAYVPIDGDGYMYIDCFWVSGKYKGMGYANELLNYCINDSKNKGKKGLVVLSSAKKMPFLSDPEYLKYKGFKVCDNAKPYFELLYLTFEEYKDKPKFRQSAKNGYFKSEGVVLFYSHQCTHTEKYVKILEMVSKREKIPFKAIKIDTVESAKNAPTPFTTYSIYINGKFITNEILPEKKYLKIIDNTNLYRENNI